ncbi:M14 family zinc carboxypeptidase [Pseudoduganella danionis]|uniref:M14 family zinc carboxypeptidase n=1 Tax=Pseudoduganella danionis TaxID=1890295 RepID=UPI0035AF20AB
MRPLNFLALLTFSITCTSSVFSAAALAAPAHAAAHGPAHGHAPAHKNNAPAASNAANARTPCARLTARLQSVTPAMCQNSQLVQSGARSRQGFPILTRQQASTSKKDSVRVLLIGGIHGDELSASSAVFQWMQWLPPSDSSPLHWNIVPVLNPDGMLAAKPRRVNANGVDLNRNFPTPRWNVEAQRYWVSKTGRDPRRFPGSSPLSEPESRWLSEEIKRFKPQLIISVHAPFGVLDFDGPVDPPVRFGALRLAPIGVYPGSLGAYSGNQVPVLTIELPSAGRLPDQAEMRRIWQDMLKWIEQNIPSSNQVAMASAKPNAH